ncbi:MAG TPA: UDP-N-acetylmuramoyl-L-alanine--D-glutamate ligase, partial [Ruminococcaceae bacterium]|nr:UDP-N-acetylmuramoyl-L-alanine--D-glutamate ligase [Oscillospiraceae bacterium]
SMRKSPDIAVITNISPNHLDMHKNMEEYINAKRNILLHQDGFSRTILNLDNAITEPMQDNVRGQLFGFSTKKALSYGAYVDKQGTLWMNDGKQNTRIMKENDIVIPGSHNVENYLAATAAVWGLATPEDIRAVAGSFPGVEHRIELVREVEGSRYYNDSIATTPTRTIAGLQSFKKKIILIAGGYDKKIPFDVLGPAVVKHVSNLILLGSTANKIANAVRSVKEYHEDILPIQFVSDLEEAVQLAHKLAVSGDIVLLSPACASFDMFKDFETRGEQFKELVQGL